MVSDIVPNFTHGRKNRVKCLGFNRVWQHLGLLVPHLPRCLCGTAALGCVRPKVEISFASWRDFRLLAEHSQGRLYHITQTNAFSKKVENHEFNVALHFMHYNLCRVHQPFRVTPAMEAGLSDHVWELQELVGLIG